jgi:hypothetical protein
MLAGVPHSRMILAGVLVCDASECRVPEIHKCSSRPHPPAEAEQKVVERHSSVALIGQFERFWPSLAWTSLDRKVGRIALQCFNLFAQPRGTWATKCIGGEGQRIPTTYSMNYETRHSRTHLRRHARYRRRACGASSRWPRSHGRYDTPSAPQSCLRQRVLQGSTTPMPAGRWT